MAYDAQQTLSSPSSVAFSTRGVTRDETDAHETVKHAAKSTVSSETHIDMTTNDPPWNVTTERLFTLATKASQHSSASGNGITTTRTQAAVSQTTADRLWSDSTTEIAKLSTLIQEPSDTNPDSSSQSHILLSSLAAESSVDLTILNSPSRTTEATMEIMQNSSQRSVLESISVAQDNSSVSVLSSFGEPTNSSLLSDHTESWTSYSEGELADASTSQPDVTSVLYNVGNNSSESFLFVNSLSPDMQNLSLSMFTVPTLFSDDLTGRNNSTLLPANSNIHDVIMRESGTDDVNAAVMVTKAVTLTILAVGGVLGNALVIWSVVKRRHLHRPPFYYLLSLSLTDLSRAAFCLPLVLMTLLQGSVWRHGNSACDLFAFANSFFVLSSCVSLLNVAADRHLSLVYSHSYRRRAGGAVNLVVVLLGWTLSFLVAFPPVVGVGAYAFEVNEGQCTLRHKFYRHDNDTLGFLMVFTGLSTLTLFLYYRIFLALRAHRKMRPLQHEPARSATWTFVGPGANGQAFINWVNGFGGVNHPNVPNVVRNPPRPNLARVVSLHVAKNQHVTRLFFGMTLAFVGLWLPYQVLSYWRVFTNPAQPSVTFVTVAAWLSYAQVAVCPLVYFVTRGPMRRRPSRADVGTDDKPEYLLESIHRKK